MYCLADPVFFDSPALAQGGTEFERSVPSGWKCTDLVDWVTFRPEHGELPPQGWKIHASACLENAAEVLEVVRDYCLPREIAFKVLRSEEILLLRNAKSADRWSSGKFVTIYPVDDAQLETVLTELGARLSGQLGPYILNDLRWGDGPLYVRYGGFVVQYCVGPDGALLPAIEDGNGQLVPDRRDTTFYVPPWVTLPDFLAPHLAARGEATVDELPYRIDSALHFSNGGGVYQGVDRATGDAVVLKEARPHAGLSRDGADAVARLRRERRTLERLAGLGVVPEVRDYLEVGDHELLVLDLVEGTNLNSLFVERYPLAGYGADETEIAEYTSWALDVDARVERAVELVHSRGIVIGDLHPSNVLVQPDGEIAMIDFEVASDATDAARPGVGVPGFVAPDLRGFDVDRYALACLRIYLFLPLTRLFVLDPEKADEHAAEVADRFPVPDEFLTQAVAVIAAAPTKRATTEQPRPRFDLDPAGWTVARDSMVQAIRSSATPDRDDRLFPGSVQQFATGGGVNVAYGAAGVLYALDAVGADRVPAHEQWLVERAVDPSSDVPLGFYDGLLGVAHVLDGLGRRDAARKVVDICIDRLDGAWQRRSLDLFGGLAGIALGLSQFGETTGDPSLSALAFDVADVVAGRVSDEDDGAAISGGGSTYAGLLRGASGPALLFLRLYERNGDTALLDAAATALRQDLRRCIEAKGGMLQVNEGWRTMPYLLDGSVGIGMVLRDYLAHRDDEQFRLAAASIRKSACSPFYVTPGLFSGRAGMILALSAECQPGAGAHDPDIAAHLRRLSWHELAYRGHLAFPGDGLRRLSMDLAGGTAGVLLAIGAALAERQPNLPFLAPIP